MTAAGKLFGVPVAMIYTMMLLPRKALQLALNGFGRASRAGNDATAARLEGANA